MKRLSAPGEEMRFEAKVPERPAIPYGVGGGAYGPGGATPP
jgi:hypothetical protein